MLRPKHYVLPSIIHQTSIQQSLLLLPSKSRSLSSSTTHLNLQQLLSQMSLRGYNMNFEGYRALLNECVRKMGFREGQRVHAHMIKTRYLPSMFHETMLITLYAKCDSLRDAHQVLDKMHQRDVVSWTAMITAYSQSGYASQALNLFFQMLRSGTIPNEFTFATVLNSCTGSLGLILGRQIHSIIIKSNYDAHVFVGSSLIDMYAKDGNIHEAQTIFECLPERDVVSCNALITTFCQGGYDSQALNLFVQMLRSGTNPNEFTFSTVLTSCTCSLGFILGRQIHSLIIKSNYEDQVFVGTSLLDMYAKNGKIHEAQTIFECLPQKCVVSCNAIIFGYAQLGLDEQALELFRRLQGEGMQSNCVTYNGVLTALSGLAALDLGKQVHSHVLRSEFPSLVILQNSLIDMYSKCGNLTYSRRIFDTMHERTVISWNAMLVGYSKHGEGREVLELFTLMREENKIKPDSVTILAVLSGCSHGGLEDMGLDVFYDMTSGKIGVKPEMEHFGCVVDLLGRAGRVEEAFEFIKKMPFEPTAAVWGSLLGACRVHSDVDIGEIVGRRLLEIEPGNSGNYVILSNLYASVGRWADVRSLRDLMLKKKVVKEPGRSWIELDQVLHTFHASDSSHPRTEELCAKVKELSVRFKEAGYFPDLSCVLHDVDEEQKEKMLLGHSEKLALSFGLMATPESVPIRVIKNLRICVDCHNFAKYISKIYCREVTLRDRNRFHRIVAGKCSCRDYW